jgi:hypothetical protein
VFANGRWGAPALIMQAREPVARPVRLIVPLGRHLRHLARLIGQWLSERLGQALRHRLRPGAAA